jgi:ABC-type microcin C transport system duplicated ATPase subunit YejF
MMLNRFLFLCLLCTFPTFITANAQIRPEQHAQLRAALERDDERTAETLLREMKKAAPEAFAQNNYDYLLARLLMRRDANIEANQLLQSVVARNSVLASYALWHQAEIARVGGNAKEEQRLLQRFLSPQSGAPADHLYRERAIQRLGESYFRGGQYQSVISLLRGSASVRRDYLALIGEAQAAFEHADGYGIDQRIKLTLHGLGFRAEHYGQSLRQFSGGQKTRALLARLLLEAPDLLILDEPTNHLDSDAVEWLEHALTDWPGALILRTALARNSAECRRRVCALIAAPPTGSSSTSHQGHCRRRLGTGPLAG